MVTRRKWALWIGAAAVPGWVVCLMVASRITSTPGDTAVSDSASEAQVRTPDRPAPPRIKDTAAVVSTLPPKAPATLPAAHRVASPNDPDPTVKVEPHPITERHARTARQHRLLGAIEDAIRLDSFDAARALIEEHRAQFTDPEDWHDLRDGLELVVDCREHPGPESRLRGQQFVDDNRGSTLRRRVRRACLER